MYLQTCLKTYFTVSLSVIVYRLISKNLVNFKLNLQNNKLCKKGRSQNAIWSHCAAVQATVQVHKSKLVLLNLWTLHSITQVPFYTTSSLPPFAPSLFSISLLALFSIRHQQWQSSQWPALQTSRSSNWRLVLHVQRRWNAVQGHIQKMYGSPGVNTERKPLWSVCVCVSLCVLMSWMYRALSSLHTCLHEQLSESGSRATGSGLKSCMTSWISSRRHTVIW